MGPVLWVRSRHVRLGRDIRWRGVVFKTRCKMRLLGRRSLTPPSAEVMKRLEMWASAQRDGRPSEYRWHSLFNAEKFGWRSLLEYRAVTLPRRETLETRWNWQGCSKLANGSQPLVGRSSPYYEDTQRSYRCLTTFFRLSIHASAAMIQLDKVVQWCQNGNFCVLYFQRAACSTFDTCILNSH